MQVGHGQTTALPPRAVVKAWWWRKDHRTRSPPDSTGRKVPQWQTAGCLNFVKVLPAPGHTARTDCSARRHPQSLMTFHRSAVTDGEGLGPGHRDAEAGCSLPSVWVFFHPCLPSRAGDFSGWETAASSSGAGIRPLPRGKAARRGPLAMRLQKGAARFEGQGAEGAGGGGARPGRGGGQGVVERLGVRGGCPPRGVRGGGGHGTSSSGARRGGAGRGG